VMPAQRLHHVDNGGQDFLGAVLQEVLLQDPFPQKVADVSLLVEQECGVTQMDL